MAFKKDNKIKSNFSKISIGLASPDEILELSSGEVLKPGGRLSVITYHSLEDRMVKNIMKTGNVEGRQHQDFYGRISSPYRLIQNKPITPTTAEQHENPRSRSAKLRIAERTDDK